MKIAFFCHIYPGLNGGGTEAVTYTLAKALTRAGHDCICFYESGAPDDTDKPYSNVYHIGYSDAYRQPVKEMLLENDTDVIINQHWQPNTVTGFLGGDSLGTDVKIYTALHSMPGWEMLSLAKNMRYNKKRGTKELVKRAIKMCSFPIYKSYYRSTTSKVYKQAIKDSSRQVLLSDRFRQDFIKAYGIPEDQHHKIRSVNNPLRFSTGIEPGAITDKKKIVLMVSRLDEVSKRITSALRIWKRVEASGMNDWRLVIVGDGPQEDLYKKLAAKLRLKQIGFEGRQDPLSYYREAALLMVTSAYEGWGMTLTEAQQNGVVPVAFDTFASLHDIITDGYNGAIIPPGNERAFALKLRELMYNSLTRQQMAVNAIRSSNRFSSDNIARQWIAMFEEK